MIIPPVITFDNILTGSVAAYTIASGLGNDTLRGGQGADAFHFTLGSGQDIITDFNLADDDRILFSASTIYSVTDLGANSLLTIGTDSITVIGMGIFNPKAAQFI
jgi:Ca2+-binding RTX toxin-like protein